MPDNPTSIPTTRWSVQKRIAIGAGSAIVFYFVLAYIFVPAVWTRYARKHPSLEELPGITYTADGIPGDPLNVALIGTKAELIKSVLAADWHPADPLSLKSSLEIVEATVLERPYEDAPVSNLYLWNRIDDDARRHHEAT